MTKPPSLLCQSCAIYQNPDTAHFIYTDDMWTVNLRLDSPPKPLIGWSVLQPRRHVNNLSELNTKEKETMSHLLSHCDTVLRKVLKVPRIYVCLFSESAMFHMHFHLIPRRSDLPEEFIGPSIFNLFPSEVETASEVELNNLARQLRVHLMSE